MLSVSGGYGNATGIVMPIKIAGNALTSSPVLPVQGGGRYYLACGSFVETFAVRNRCTIEFAAVSTKGIFHVRTKDRFFRTPSRPAR
jgi:hypothetical protein